MSVEGWTGIVMAMGAWVGVTAAIITYLHRQRTEIINKLRDQIENSNMLNSRAHEALRVQFVDVTQTFVANYLRKDDFSTAMREINLNLTETRKDIGGVHNRIDILIQGVEWRRRNVDG